MGVEYLLRFGDIDRLDEAQPRRQVNRPQQRLARQEPDGRRRLEELRYPHVGPVLVLDRGAEPDVRERPSLTGNDDARALVGARWVGPIVGPIAMLTSLHAANPRGHPARSLREHLKYMPAGEIHHGEHPRDELVGHVVVEEVAHAVHEHASGLAPVQRVL